MHRNDLRNSNNLLDSVDQTRAGLLRHLTLLLLCPPLLGRRWNSNCHRELAPFPPVSWKQLDHVSLET